MCIRAVFSTRGLYVCGTERERTGAGGWVGVGRERELKMELNVFSKEAFPGWKGVSSVKT